MIISEELEQTLKKVEELRAQLEVLLRTKSPLEPDVIAASQMLDAMLNTYHENLKKRK